MGLNEMNCKVFMPEDDSRDWFNSLWKVDLEFEWDLSYWSIIPISSKFTNNYGNFSYIAHLKHHIRTL